MKVNQIKAGVVLSYISEAISVLLGLLYTPVMLRLLGKSEYGLYQLSSSVISYLSILSFGFGTSYIRYYSKYLVADDDDSIAKLNGLFMIVFTIIGVICILAGMVLVCNVENIFSKSLTESELTTSRILMSLMVFNLAITFPGSVFTSYITANEQYIFQRIALILKNILNPFLTIPLLLLGYKSIGVVVVQTILSVSLLISNIVFCKRKLKISFDFKEVNFPLLRELFSFSFWIFLNQIIDQINWNVDKFILGVFSGTVTVAVYGVASQLNNLYMTFSTSISNVFVPKINRIVSKTDDNAELTKLFTKVGRIQFIILFLIMSGFIIFGKYFICMWAGSGYEESYRITLLMIIPITIPLIQNLGITIQQAKNMHRYRSIVYAGMAVLNIIISIPLAKSLGGTGAVIGTAISLIVGNGFVMNVFYHKKIGIDIVYFWKQIAKFIPALILPTIVGVLILRFVAFDSVIVFASLIVVYATVYCVSMWCLGMNTYEKELILKSIGKFLRCKND